MLEFVLCFPFVVLVLICSVDLGRALNTYFTVTRIVYEGTRYAGQVNSLELTECDDVTECAAYPGHMLVRNRVDTLLLRYNINPGTLPANYLVTERMTTVNDRDRVRVGLRIPFQPIFPLFQQALSILGTDATGPYL